jgi:hypothetical protein
VSQAESFEVALFRDEVGEQPVSSEKLTVDRNNALRIREALEFGAKFVCFVDVEGVYWAIPSDTIRDCVSIKLLPPGGVA